MSRDSILTCAPIYLTRVTISFRFSTKWTKMEIIQHKGKLKINDIDFLQHFGCGGSNGILLPNSIRCIICGPSNYCMTNIMFNLLFQPDGLHFISVYVFSISLFQPKYRMLENVMSLLCEKGICYWALVKTTTSRQSRS